MKLNRKFLLSLSLLFPEGEQFFVRTLRAEEHLLSEQDKEDLRAFYGDEARHTRWHKAINGALGLDLNKINTVTAQRIDRCSKSRTEALCTTMVLEAITYAGAKILMCTAPLVLKGVPDDEKTIWLNHAKEETYHVPVVHEKGKKLGITNMQLLTHAPKVCYALVSQIAYNWKELK